MPDLCPHCQGSGLCVTVSSNGDRFAQECSCQLGIRVQRRLDRSGIPAKFRNRSFESFETGGKSRSVYDAKEFAKRFVDNYPYGIDGQGVIFVGNSGRGKTHLAIAMLQALILEKQIKGLFYDYQDLLKQIQNSYNPSVATTEHELLRPVFEVEVLVLDDLGSTRPTDWVFDTVSYILNSRYNRYKTTIITTNFPYAPPVSNAPAKPAAEYRAAARGESLGDRVGERMWSRLHEMCVFQQVDGDDQRKGEQRAQLRGL